MAELKRYLDETGLKAYHQGYVSTNIKALQDQVDTNAKAISDLEDLATDTIIPSILEGAFSKIAVEESSSSYNFESSKTVNAAKDGSTGSTFTIKAGKGITLTPDVTNLTLTIASTTYSVATASSDGIGGSNGLLSSKDKEKLDKIADNANNYTLPAAGKLVIGGVSISDDANLTLNLTTGALKLTSDNVVDALGYAPLQSVPTATYSTLGLLKPSKSYSVDATLKTKAAADTTTKSISINTITGIPDRYYAVEVDKGGIPFVNVPWKNTEYGADRGLSLSSGKFGHSNTRDSSTESTSSEGGNTRILKYSESFNIPSITYDQYGHIVATDSITLTLPASDNEDTRVTSVEKHYTPTKSGTYSASATPSTSASWGSTSLVTGVTLGKDAAGHITGLEVSSIQFPDIPNIDASKITTGIINIDRLPASALERLLLVDNKTKLLALTSNDVQNGDSVKVTYYSDTTPNATSSTSGAISKLFIVRDSSKLGSLDAFTEYTASTYWSNISGIPSTLVYTTDLKSKGSSIQPIYFDSTGVPQSCKYQLNKTVPSDAVFTDHTYTAGDGISISNSNEITNSGVRSISTGTKNGTINVDTNGSTNLISVYGLGSAAYTNSTAYASATHTHNYAGSTSSGGAATSASKLTNTSDIGGTAQPVYFTKSGTPATCGYAFTSDAPSSTAVDTTIPTSKAVYTAIYNAIDKAIAASY